MSFTCQLCSLQIEVGQPMLSDEKMNLAHQICVLRSEGTEREKVKAIKSVVAEIRPVFVAAEPCLLPSAPKVCTECQKPAISMCPCGAFVHHDFGYNGLNCSGRHEAKCAYAAASRALPKKSNEEKAKQDLFVEIFKGRNGKHQKPTKRNRR